MQTATIRNGLVSYYEKIMLNDISLLILSCQKFSDLWSNNLNLLEKNWKEHPKAYLVSDGEGVFDVPKPNNVNFLVFNLDMTDRIIAAIEEIDTKYVLITLDDYFIDDEVDITMLERIYKYIVQNDIDYCGFHRNRKRGTKKIKGTNLAKLGLNEVYELNFYPSIWKKDSFVKCLKKREDIWKAEVRLTRRAREIHLNAICCLDKKIFPFKDIVRKGEYLRSAYNYLKKNKLYISDRPKKKFISSVSLSIRTMISKITPKPLKPFMRKMLRKSGLTVYSDYENTDD